MKESAGTASISSARVLWRYGLTQWEQAKTSDFVRKIAETFATRMLLIGMSLISSVVVTRALGPEGRGLYAVAGAVGAMGIQFGNLGLHASNTYYVARNREILPTLLANSLLVSLALGGLGACAAWFIFVLRPDWAPLPGAILGLSLIWIPLGLTSLLLQNLLLGINKVRAYNWLELWTRVLSVFLIAALLIFGAATVERLFLTGIVTAIVGIVWMFFILRPQELRLAIPSLKLLKNCFGYGLSAYIAALFSFLVIRVDLLMIQYMLGAEQTGYYSIAVSLSDFVYMLPVVVGTLLFPKLSALSENAEKWELAKKVLRWVTVAMLGVCVVAGLLAYPLTRILYGVDFLPAVPAFLWLLPGIMLLSVNTIFMNYFASVGMPSIVIYSPGGAVVLNFLMNLELIPLVGIVGASISSTVCYGAMLLCSLAYMRKNSGL